MNRRHGWVKVAAAAFVATLLGTPLFLGAAPKPAPAPKLAVIIAADGLSYSRLVSYRPWYIAGLKRLLYEGFVEREARYRHLNTDTGPGHAALSTGAPPRVTGIVSNEWSVLRPDGSIREVYCTDQAEPGASEESAVVIPGPKNLRVPTLGDRLHEAHPESRVVSLSAKARAAVFLAGKSPDHLVYWYDNDTGRFVTSAAYNTRSRARGTVESLVKEFNKNRAGGKLPARFGLLWKKLGAPLSTLSPLSGPPDAEKPLPIPPEDLVSFQVPTVGLGFDHDLAKHAKGYFSGVYTSPYVDELTAVLALSVLGDESLAMGRGDAPDLLCLSFSAHDTVSHYYGNESEEELDVLRRLDLQIGRILDALDRSHAKGEVLLALSSDHGFTPIPEAAKKREKFFTGGRLVSDKEALSSFVARLNVLVTDELCLDPAARPLHRVHDDWNLFYNRGAFPMKTVAGPCGPAGRDVTTPDVDAALSRAAGRFYKPEIERILFKSQRERWPADDPAVEFAKNDFDAERSGDAMLIPRPGVIMHWDPGRGSAHGSHYESDIHVPLIFWGGPFSAGSSSEPVTPYDLAPSLARVLGLSLPDAVGRSLK